MRIEDRPGGTIAGLRRLRLLMGVAMVGLAGCGGGGSGTPPDATPPSAGVFDASYLGYAVGDRRLYRLADGSGFDSEDVQAALTVRGVPAVELAAIDGPATYLALNDQGVDVLPAESDQGVRSLFGAVPLVRFGPATVAPEVLFDVSKQITFHGPDGTSAETRSILVRGWVKGFEDVATSLGTFRQAARVQTEITSTATAGEVSLVSLVVTEEWYAKGVGVVRRDVQATSTGSPPFSAAYELVAYRVGGQASDGSAPQVVSAVMAPPVQQPLPPPYIGITYMQTTTFAFDDWFVPSPLLSGTATVRDAETGTTYRGSLAVGDDLRSLRFTVENGLPSNRPLVLELPDVISDWAGNVAAPRELPFTRDTLGPQVVSMTPTSAAADVGAASLFRVVFDERVRATESTAFVIRTADGAEVARLPVTADGTALVATLSQALPGVGVAYDWFVEGTVLDTSGNAGSFSGQSATFVSTLGRFASAGPVVDWPLMSASSLVDLNGDGYADFVYWASLQGGPAAGRLGVRLGQPDGTLGPDTLLSAPGDEPSGYTYTDLRVGDFDGDGRQDVAVAAPGRLRVYLQRGAMGFDAQAPLYAFRGSIAGVIPGATGPDTLLVLRDPELTEPRMFERLRWHVDRGAWVGFAEIAWDDAFRRRWAIGDLDGDGSPELAWLLHTVGGRTELATAPITADGFGAIVRRPLAGPVVSGNVVYGSGRLALADVDGDAVLDLLHLQASVFGEPPSAVVWPGAGDGGFGPARTVEVRRAGGIPVYDLTQEGATAKERGVYLGDFDGDGYEDMLFEVEWSAAEVALLRQQADGRFVPTSTAAGTKDQPWRDLDGNGLVDVVGRNRIYRQSLGN